MRHSWFKLALSLVLAACGAEDAEAPPPGGGYDQQIGDDAIAALEAKSDGDPCEGHGAGDVDGASLLVLVNKGTGGQLRADYVPADLVPVDVEQMMPGREGLMRIGALEGLRALTGAALAEQGFELRARSVYRSFKNQCFTFDYWVEEKGEAHADRYSARPGRSQHQLGTTVDITAESWGWQIEPEVATTPEAAWLAGNAGRFGFALSYPDGVEETTGYGFEPWHFRYIGVEAAAEMEAKGLILEAYLRGCRDGASDLSCPDEPAPEVPANYRFIGGGCASDTDCASLGPSARCLTDGHPGGHCTLPCTRGCPDRPGRNALTFCAAEAGAGLCRSQCDFGLFPGAGCREGYACLDGERPDGSRSADVCLPD